MYYYWIYSTEEYESEYGEIWFGTVCHVYLLNLLRILSVFDSHSKFKCKHRSSFILHQSVVGRFTIFFVFLKISGRSDIEDKMTVAGNLYTHCDSYQGSNWETEIWRTKVKVWNRKHRLFWTSIMPNLKSMKCIFFNEHVIEMIRKTQSFWNWSGIKRNWNRRL